MNDPRAGRHLAAAGGLLLAIGLATQLLALRAPGLAWVPAVSGSALVLALLLRSWRSRARQERRAQGTTSTFTTIFDSLAEGVIVADGQLRTILINPAACALLAITPTRALGQPVGFGRRMLDRSGRRMDAAELPDQLALQGEEVDNQIIGVVLPDGTRRWTSCTSRLLGGQPGGDEALVVITIDDVTSRVEAETASEAETAQLRHRALHDSLTGLPNRTLLMDRLARAKMNAGRRGTSTGLLVIDLDGFKDVNDTLGHAAGDEVLVQAAVRLRTTLRASDTAARLGGDEFVLLCEDLHPGVADLEIGRISERVQALLNEPYITSVGPADVGASVGWAVAQPGEPLDLDLVVAADEAMLADKRTRKRDTRQAPSTMAPMPTDSLLDDTALSVYIVDDDPAMRLLAMRILESSGAPLRIVGEAADGASAIHEILTVRPDLVLCDVMMPVVSGPQVVTAVREQAPEQQFIFWSATTAPELERHQVELGVPYVLKDRIEELPAAILEASEDLLIGREQAVPQVSPQGDRS